MLFAYRVLINFILIFSPIILITRIIKQKESINRFREKFGFYSKKRIKGNLIWFHGASVGEIQSIVPLLEKFEKDKKINQILITSNTLSSSKIIEKIKLKKITHQFFPIDNYLISKKFLDYWRPSKAFFIDSEIWPNTIFNLKEKKIPIILINGRITKKTYKRWMFLSGFSKKIFSNFNLCLSSSYESLVYLKNLNAKNVKFIGNLKFSESEKDHIDVNKKLNKFFKNKKIWSASSTHQSEEIFCGQVHLELKKNINNILTIIIPRHVNRSNEIKKDLEDLNLKVHLDEPQKRIDPNTDIYLVNSYGKTKSFYKYCKNVFLGGSIIKHGGQNPIEAVRFGCSVLHGPNIENFREIYKFLKKNKISYKINKKKDLTNNLAQLFSKKTKSKKIQKKIKLIGNQILKKTYNEICH